jgi:hypothetical protein
MDFLKRLRGSDCRTGLWRSLYIVPMRNETGL